MRPITTMLLPLITIGALAPSDARAVSVTFCAKYQVDYVDSDLAGDNSYGMRYGDYFETNSDKVARGVSIRTRRVGNPSETEQHFAAWDGADAGCAGPFTLVAGAQYDVLIISKAEVNSNTIRVYGSPDDMALWASTALDDWTAPSVTTTKDIVTANTHPAWDVIAAAGHALWRRNGGRINKTYDFFTIRDTCGIGETPDVDCELCPPPCSTGGDVHLETEPGEQRRFLILHEMAHSIARLAAGTSTPEEYNSDEGVCSFAGGNHELQSKEWQSAAIQEGFAHYYSALAFNMTTDTNCGFVYWKEQDFDFDPNTSTSDLDPISCESGPRFTESSIDPYDYLGDVPCDTVLTNHATTLDWLRFWWDFDQEESTISFGDALDIYVVAVTGVHGVPAPYGDWDPAPSGSTPNEDRPGVRMREAADWLGLDVEWNAHDDMNGVHR